MERIVTGAHNGSVYPRLVAEHANQHTWMVDALLHEAGPAETWFHVWEAPLTHPILDRAYPPRWLRIGYHNGYGAAFFHDDSTPPGADWAWIALRGEPLADPPSIFYDVATPVIFPPVAVMPMDRLREVILEWCASGRQPVGVDWFAVNDQLWDLDDAGNVIHSSPGQRHTIHALIRGQVIRKAGWGTSRPAT